jgi:hypothetical protein
VVDPIRRGTLLFTFTVRGKQLPERSMRTFWHWYDKHFGKRHFAWLEAHHDHSGWHYQAIVPDAPQAAEGHSVAALQAEWARVCAAQLQDVNLDLVWLPKWRRKAKRGAVAYALSYSKKRGDKQYQQEYDDAPTGLHTVMYSRLTQPAALVQRVSADFHDFLETAALEADSRPVRSPGGGWVFAVRRMSRRRDRCFLRLQLLWEVDVAAGVVRMLGVAVEAQEQAPPLGDLAPRRLKARRELSRCHNLPEFSRKRRPTPSTHQLALP